MQVYVPSGKQRRGVRCRLLGGQVHAEPLQEHLAISHQRIVEDLCRRFEPIIPGPGRELKVDSGLRQRACGRCNVGSGRRKHIGVRATVQRTEPLNRAVQRLPGVGHGRRCVRYLALRGITQLLQGLARAPEGDLRVTNRRLGPCQDLTGRHQQLVQGDT